MARKRTPATGIANNQCSGTEATLSETSANATRGSDRAKNDVPIAAEVLIAVNKLQADLASAKLHTVRTRLSRV